MARIPFTLKEMSFIIFNKKEFKISKNLTFVLHYLKNIFKIVLIPFILFFGISQVFAHKDEIKLKHPVDLNLGKVDLDVSQKTPFKKHIENRFSNLRSVQVNSGFKISSNSFLDKVSIIEFFKNNYFIREKILPFSFERIQSNIYIQICVFRI